MGYGYRDQRERPQDRQSQAFQTRQWPDSGRVLYLAALHSIHLEGSAFGAYYHRLAARGRKSGSALMAAMRKMLAVTTHLLMHEEEGYDPTLGDVLAERLSRLL
jgi:hypothetical protein